MVFEAYLVPMFGTILGHLFYRYIIGRIHWPYSVVAKKSSVFLLNIVTSLTLGR